MCPKGCLAFTNGESKQDMAICPVCAEIVMNAQGNPILTFDYISFLHGFRLQWANSVRSQILQSYPRECITKYEETGVTTDFWTSRLHRELKKKQVEEFDPMFSRPHDAAFFFSADGAKLFKTRY